MKKISGVGIMDFVTSGFNECEIRFMKERLADIAAKYPWETEQRLLSMAISRLYLDLVDPPVADSSPDEESLAAMRNGRSERFVTTEDLLSAGKGLRKMFYQHLKT
ncbi:hypothetical protein B1757_02355 [Acidithiobacillus marinus]|uniref:Uncharacterized protein n=1 Tax=Acidithiobacillus marinus TaxID=187490 RepID=A0A2I1DPL9_9PROT|nr:hypothetical protein [Acidithiobacillus marinus]PKY11823.1 hypothetical protein B1757_02355 [Acidithiobacillus marinus]